MAVEARHLNLFPPQFTGNREMMNPIQGNGNMYQTEIGYGVPLSGTTTVAEGLLPLYNSTATAAMKSESSLTYNNNVLPLPRKRSRDSINPILSFPSPVQQQSNNNNGNNKTCFLGHDISFHMEQQQLDIDRIISQHGEITMRREPNMARFGSNQRGNNEATANALRTNLEQVLAAAANNREEAEAAAADEVHDAQSCCGSNWEATAEKTVAGGGGRECRNCGKEEACVLLLPCRHLCLCTICGSTLHVCPVCKSTKNASVHVNL
ncbi:hypothetical protein GOBAR_DD31432 [Gossypium barbadense]|nr:hypothetical protein GOBAR_DD31432 [Gossypium barbadense]